MLNYIFFKKIKILINYAINDNYIEREYQFAQVTHVKEEVIRPKSSKSSVIDV